AELVRLHPGKIVIVGGTASVSAAVSAELAGIAPVARLAGADRYATSRLVAADAFGSLAATAYVATGADFPGALAAASAAARAGAPVVLVPAGGFLPDLATAALLRTLHTRTVKIAGGTADVTSLTEFWLKLQLGGASVTRYSGADRYATSAALNLNAFTSATTVYLASGTSYQDALVGSALAGAKSAPLYLTPATCVPRATLTAITRLGATRVVLIGTATALTGDVAALKPCP
ncbi:cell wall-binding repeat-containing protein, partial [Cryobacterium sp. 10I1]